MAFREFDFPSYNERDNVKAWLYMPVRKPRAIVQVVHGFREHSRRYLYLILALNEAGFVVCADDHVGHGKTAADSDTWGDFGDKGYMTTTEDEKRLHDIALESYPGLPFVMFGHSWGSMITRSYAACYGSTMTGMILCGTMAHMDTIAPVAADLKVAVEAGLGGEIEAKHLERIFAKMNDRVENIRTPKDWISRNPDVVDDNIRDPLVNPKVPNNQSLYDFTQLVEAISGLRWAEKVPLDLPVYNIAGDDDPVGNYGEGVYEVSNCLINTGHKKVSTRLFPGYRHEICQEPDLRPELIGGIINFIESII